MNVLIPYFVSFFAIACYSLMGPVAKKVSVDLKPFTFIAAASFFLFIASFFVAWLYEREGFSEAAAKINPGWMAFYFLCNFVSYAGYLWAITRIPVAQFEMFGIFVPVIGGLFAWLLLNEPFHTRYFLALALMGAGIFIAVYPDLKAK